jgi:hypothetical protein
MGNSVQAVVVKQHQAQGDSVSPQDLTLVQSNINAALKQLQDELRRRYGDGSFTVEDKKALLLQNAWLSGASDTPSYRESPSYYKDPFGRVWLSGFVKGGTVGSTIALLPAGYRPLKGERFPVEANGAYGWIYVAAAASPTPGAVQYGGGSTALVSLSGVSFVGA